MGMFVPGLIAMMMVMLVAMFVLMFVGVTAYLHLATAQTAAAFFTHIIAPVLPLQYRVRARAAARRLDCGNGDIR